MRRILLVTLLVAAASTPALGQRNFRRARAQRSGDEEKLEQLVRDWADAAVHADVQRLERLEDASFQGASEGMKFNKRTLIEAIRSGAVKVGGWTIEDVKVRVHGNSAEATGRSKLTNAVYMGKDYSGEYEWTDHFVKGRDGNWRAVSSIAKRVKK
jgi:ketosteroid isomerase-like protein